MKEKPSSSTFKDSTPGCTTRLRLPRQHGPPEPEDPSFLAFRRILENPPAILRSKNSISRCLWMKTSLCTTPLAWRLKMNYGREYMGCARSTFVIQPDGTTGAI